MWQRACLDFMPTQALAGTTGKLFSCIETADLVARFVCTQVGYI